MVTTNISLGLLSAMSSKLVAVIRAAAIMLNLCFEFIED
jgi:hypothetical protein